MGLKFKARFGCALHGAMLLYALCPPSPPQNHLLPEEALGGLVIVDQRLSLAEAVSNLHDCHFSLVVKEAQLRLDRLLQL